MRVLAALCLLLLAACAHRPADVDGSADPALLERLRGSWIVLSRIDAPASSMLPLSRLEPTPDETHDEWQNRVFLPRERRLINGRIDRLVYLAGKDVAMDDWQAHYQRQVEARGGRLLYRCLGGDCGGDARFGADHEGGITNLLDFAYPAAFVRTEPGSAGWCALMSWRRDQELRVLELPGEQHVLLLGYQLDPQEAECAAHAGQPALVVLLHGPVS